MDKHAVAIALEEIGTLLDLQGENRFKARAFLSAARAVDKMEGDFAQLVRSRAIENIAGIGPATARVIYELAEAGQSKYLDDVRGRTPAALRELLAVPGLGISKVKQLRTALGIETLADLQEAAAAGRIAGVRGFGEKTQAKILQGIEFVRGGAGRRRLATALESGRRMQNFLAGQPGIVQAEIAGELRRCLETVDGVDFVIAADDDMCEAVVNAFMELAPAPRAERSSKTSARVVLADGLALRVQCVTPVLFPTTLLFHTGTRAHLDALVDRAVQRDLRLDETGLWRGRRRLPIETEADIYAELDLQFVPPELREDAAGVAAAALGKLPELVERDDLRGCFHCHTTYSDGRATVAQMAEAAADRGWRYLGIADHSQYAGYAGGLSVQDIKRQHREIDAWNDSNGRRVWVFKGIEADILPDGTLDYAANGNTLDSFDFVIGSVHSRFRMTEAEMTRRILRAMEDPHLTFLGHPTGRLLLSRAPYPLDVPEVMTAAAARGVAIEINGDPHRLDLDWRYWPDAKRRGIRCAINPDAHSTSSLDYVRYGVAMARKGGLEREDIVNTWPLRQVRTELRRRH